MHARIEAIGSTRRELSAFPEEKNYFALFGKGNRITAHKTVKIGNIVLANPSRDSCKIFSLYLFNFVAFVLQVR